MKKIIFLTFFTIVAITTNAQVRIGQFDSAWQRQFLLNQIFGSNDNILFGNNGDRRRQIESLQRDSVIKTAQIVSLKADSAVKTRQIADLTTRLNDLVNLVNVFTNRTVIVEGKVTALEKAPKDTFTFGNGFIVDAKKQINVDSVAINTVINRLINASTSQLSTNYNDILKRLKDSEVNINNTTTSILGIAQNILDISKILEANDSRTKKIEARLEDVVSRVIIIEAFKTAIKNL